jgi:DNA modification methylase
MKTVTQFGTVLLGDAFAIKESITEKFPLIICDPPYGKIVKDIWDRKRSVYPQWFDYCTKFAAPDCVICLWGGIGNEEDRGFLQFAACMDAHLPWTLHNWITWSKKRAYGKADNYLFTREECLVLKRGKPVFNIPLLDSVRGYPGYNKKYPAKSEFLRRTNVWTDINELFKGKIHPTQKPDRLYQVLIETHSSPGDTVFDPCAGSLTTARACKVTGRKFFCVEKELEYIDAGLNTL